MTDLAFESFSRFICWACLANDASSRAFAVDSSLTLCSCTLVAATALPCTVLASSRALLTLVYSVARRVSAVTNCSAAECKTLVLAAALPSAVAKECIRPISTVVSNEAFSTNVLSVRVAAILRFAESVFLRTLLRESCDSAYAFKIMLAFWLAAAIPTNAPSPVNFKVCIVRLISSAVLPCLDRAFSVVSKVLSSFLNEASRVLLSVRWSNSLPAWRMPDVSLEILSMALEASKSNCAIRLTSSWSVLCFGLVFHFLQFSRVLGI